MREVSHVWVSILLAFLLGLFLGAGIMIFCLSLCYIAGTEDHARDYSDENDPEDSGDDQH